MAPNSSSDLLNTYKVEKILKIEIYAPPRLAPNHQKKIPWKTTAAPTSHNVKESLMRSYATAIRTGTQPWWLKIDSSVLVGETYALADSFDQYLSIIQDLVAILRRRLPLTIVTNRERPFFVITSMSSMISVKRFIMYLSASKEA